MRWRSQSSEANANRSRSGSIYAVIPAAARKPAKRIAAKSKAQKVRAKAPAKRALAKKPRAKNSSPPRKVEVEVVDVETIEEVAPGVAVVTDYEVVDVHPTGAENDEPGFERS